MKNLKKNGGFTLVELIVVIAILAILAAVAVPAYSGYIEKANRAGDETLLAAVNRAYASACIDNSYDPYLDLDSISAKMIITDGKIDLNKVAPAALKDSFALYFEGNENSSFKVIDSLTYVKALGQFAATDSVGMVSLEYTLADGSKVTVQINPEDVDNVNGSIFMNETAGLGINALMGKLGDVTGFAGAVINGSGESGALSTVIADEDFMQHFGGYLGIEGADKMTVAQIQQAILTKYTDENGVVTLTEEQQNSMMANALVLYAAQSSSIDKGSATTLLSGNAKQSILDTLNGTNGKTPDTAGAMAQAALAYGMVTAYAHSLPDDYVDPDTGKTKSEILALANDSENPIGALTILDNAGFKSYVSGVDGQEAITGYLSAMSMINSGTQDNAVAGDVLSNGFENNEQLKDLIEGALSGN